MMDFKKAFILILMTLSLTACSVKANTYGIKPLYPENRMSSGAFGRSKILFTEVDSLQPLLRWESFPAPEDRELYWEGLFESIKDTHYDIKIWLSDNDSPGLLIYSETGLPESKFKLQKPLLYCSKYFWTVRARFEVEGKTRVMDWGVSTGGLPEYYLEKKGYRRLYGVGGNLFIGRLPFVPNPNLYRFKTSCPERKDEAN